MKSSQFIRFERRTAEETGRTQVWAVVSQQRGTILGRIKWFARWRQYGFHPESGTVFNNRCLRDITEFTEDLMATWRAARRR
jgi:hypothetical protein